MTMSLNIGPIAALIAGILILIIPRLLNYIIAIYLIVVGVVGLFGPVAGGGRAEVVDAPRLVLQSTSPDAAKPIHRVRI
jgi:multisubunit Na+/H+ antiporter MnhC subunit